MNILKKSLKSKKFAKFTKNRDASRHKAINSYKVLLENFNEKCKEPQTIDDINKVTETISLCWLLVRKGRKKFECNVFCSGGK